jgi:hypothetical protein
MAASLEKTPTSISSARSLWAELVFGYSRALEPKLVGFDR